MQSGLPLDHGRKPELSDIELRIWRFGGPFWDLV